MRKVYPERTCPNCNVVFRHPDSRQKYCSMKCRDEAFKGSGNPNYKGGSKIADYRVVCVDGNGRYTYEHRFVMEQHLGRKLLSTEHVHHIDGNKTNNDIANLQIVTSHEHRALYHRAYSTDTHKVCTKCGELKPKTDYHKNTKRSDGLVSRCKTCALAADTRTKRN